MGWIGTGFVSDFGGFRGGNVSGLLRSRQVCKVRAEVPTSMEKVLEEAEKSVKAAIADGMKMLEVQFPPVSSVASSAALNETMDANRRHVREIVRGFVPEYTGRLCVAFPDVGEAKLARKAWEMDDIGQAFRVSTIERAHQNEEDELFFLMNPGFNVDEYLNMEKYDDKKRVAVVINGELDRIRGGYYPRIFYPKLHKVSERSLRNFQPVYFLKPMANRGMLLRAYPDQWGVYFFKSDNSYECLLESNDRPGYVEVEKLLRNAADNERLQRQD